MRDRNWLALILAVGVLTLWVRERWALTAVQAMACLYTAYLLAGVALGTRRLAAGAAVLWPALMCAWGAVQITMGWTAVAAATREATLYWLAAACFVLLGRNVCAEAGDRERFLKTVLVAGSAIGLLGTLQLFTSAGKVFWLFPSGYESLVVGPFVYRNNYAAFAELLIPIALFFAFRSRTHSGAYLLTAAALVASVIACGSRAGAVVVAMECAAAFLLWPRELDGTGRGRFRMLLIFAGLTAVFGLVVGFQFVWSRFSGDGDPYVIRRDFLASSVAMFKAQPVHGFGLGTWPSVYPQFAVADTGMFANHAHNEWAQWAAEGGFPALVLPLAAFLWAVLPAARSVWGIGLIAVFLHSAVDYPFVRLGLGAWFFALFGALAAFDRERGVHAAGVWGRRGFVRPRRVFAAVAAAAFAFGAFYSVKLAWADALFRRGAPEDLSHASRVCPDNAVYHFALAAADHTRSVEELRRALALNPYLTRARLELSADLEERHHLDQSEAELLEAASRDRQFAAAWALANFYFRQSRPAPFWHWARKSAEMSYSGLAPLFDLCFEFTDDAQQVLDRVAAVKRPAELQFLDYLSVRQRFSDARVVARRIAAAPGAGDRDALLDYVDRAIAAGLPGDAREVWNALCRWGLLPYDVAEPAGIVNGDFARPFLSRGFDWLLPPVEGVSAAVSREGAPALEIYFSGRQPEACRFLSQAVPMREGLGYTLHFEYRTTDVPAPTGLSWSVGPNTEFALSAADKWARADWQFTAPANPSRLVLAYRRVPGSTRIEGSVSLRSISISNP